MPDYVVLMNLTAEGAEQLTGEPEAAREIADTIREELESQDGALHSLLWTTGEFDGVAIVEAPSDRHIAAVALALARSGSVRTKTLTAFGSDAMEDVVGKLRGGKLRGGSAAGDDDG